MARRLVFVLLTGLLVGALVGANYHFVSRFPGGNDFLPRWLALRLWILEGRNPYAPEVTEAIQRAIFGRPARPGEDVSHFVYPLYVVFVLGPLALLPYTLARALWMTALEGASVGLALLALKWARWSLDRRGRLAFVLWTFLSYHSIRTVVLGQYAGWNAFLLALSLWLLAQGRDRIAGVLLALTTVKPQMAFLILPWLLLWAWSTHRRTFLWSTLTALACLWGISFLLLPSWLAGWVRQMLEYPSYTGPGSPLTALAAILPFEPSVQRLFSGVLHGLGFLYTLTVWKKGWGKEGLPFQWATAMTLVMTNLLGFRTGTPHALMLWPALALVGAQASRISPWTRRAFPVLLFILGVGEWVLFRVTLEGNAEHMVMLFPLPLFVWAGLESLRKRVLDTNDGEKQRPPQGQGSRTSPGT